MIVPGFSKVGTMHNPYIVEKVSNAGGDVGARARTVSGLVSGT